MKGLFNNVLLLSCAGILSTVLATPVPYVQKTPHVRYISNLSEDAIEERFNETDDVCQKAVIALYKVNEFYKQGNMEAMCNDEDNIYTEFLASGFKCNQEKYNRYFINTGLKQRDYFCSKDAMDEYCDPYAIYTNDIQVEKKIKSDFCSIRQGYNCKDKLVDYIDALGYAFYNTPSSKTTIQADVASSDEENSEGLFTMVVYKPADYIKSNYEKYCAYTGKSLKEEGEEINGGDEKPELPVSKDGLCGPNVATCPSGYCCSKHGWCGKTSSYCGKGCQSEFGKCD